MGTSTFEVAYKGSDVKGGTMDVRDLGPSLLAFGQLVQDASRAVNGDSIAVEVRVTSRMDSKSFDIYLAMEALGGTDAPLIGAAAFATLPQIWEAIFGTDDKEGLIGLLGRLLPKKKDPADGGGVTADASNHGAAGAISFAGADMRGASIQFVLARDVNTRRSTYNAIRVLEKTGIDVIATRDVESGVAYRSVEKSDVEIVRETLPSDGGEAAERTIEAWMELARASFVGSLGWSFKEANRPTPWTCQIDDAAFLADVESGGWVPHPHDMYRLRVRVTVRVSAEGRTLTERRVLAVLDKRRGPGKQGTLPETT